MRCPACATEIPDSARFCPSCGAASRTAAPAGDETRTSVPDPGAAGVASTNSGGMTPPGERFPPGSVVADRYRVVGLIGRGGMGEVYRADDLKLGRPVALKFLPESMERDPGRLARFLNEVRTAVQVTHPNVCRVHDVAEIAGRHFLSMEYVDGEDLASLLRRIGRLPGDRAVRVARQLCAGLAAAHARGVLHRDLKPGNVMIDGRGDVKITDFGLAGAIGGFEGAEIRAGTPAYMAPEQIAGREVSVRSDLYALGLVLYELFSGKPAFDDRTPEAIAARGSATPSSLTSLVGDVDPAVARIVERCLSSDPADRPGSAMAVAAALPGGDPLAAALAAGETPSPELLAEAGASEGLRPRTAIAVVLGIVLAIGAVGWISSLTVLAGRAGLDRSPAVLVDRAREILRQLGRGEDSVDRVHAWFPNWDYHRHVRTRSTDPERWNDLARTRPGALLFGYRESPSELERRSAGSIGNWLGDPPPNRPGMVEVVLDPGGRLASFRAVPDILDPPGAGTGETAADFGPLFEAAGLDLATLVEAEPRTRPARYADRRFAWTGRFADDDPAEVRVEAASLLGRPLSFQVLHAWDLPEVDEEAVDDDGPVGSEATGGPSVWTRIAQWLSPIWFVLALSGVTALAVRNVRSGRGDHRTALRFGLYLAGARLLWMIGVHPAGGFVDLLIAHLAYSAYRLVVSYVFYLALEPYARRLWPEMLVSWVRAFGGRLRDARVGRDVLYGIAAGCAFALAKGLGAAALVVWSPSNEGLDTGFWSWESLRGVRAAIAAVAGLHVTAVLDNLNGVMMFLVLRVVTGNTRIAVVLTTALALLLFSPGSLFNVTYLAVFAVVVAVFWLTLFRAGLLAVLVAFTVEALLHGVRVTADLGAWHALPMWLAYGSVLAATAWAFFAATAGRPLFRDEIQAPAARP